jgi:hypothetical protein
VLASCRAKFACVRGGGGLLGVDMVVDAAGSTSVCVLSDRKPSVEALQRAM